MTNENFAALMTDARSATTTSATFTNYAHRGGHFIIDVTAVPGTDTVTPKIEGYDSASGKYYTLLEGTASAATGTVVLSIYPSITAVANVSSNNILPIKWRVVMTHSAASEFTYSVAANLEV